MTEGRLARLAATSWASPALVFVVAAGLTCILSWQVSIWTDEAATIYATERSFSELLGMLGRIDAVHGLYYMLMSAWVPITGVDPFWLRVPSALAIGATAAGVFVLTRRLASPTTAWVAAVATVLLPRLSWAGIEARPFAFSALAAVWATWAFVRALERRTATSWVPYVLFAAAGVGFNIYVALLVVAHGVTLVVLRPPRRAWVGWAVSAVAAAVLTAPLVLIARSQQAQLGGNGDRNPLSILRKIVVNQFFLGETPSAAALPPVLGRAWQIAAVVAALVALGLVLIALVRPAAAGDRMRMLLAVTLPWILVPTSVVAAYAVLVSPLYQPRYLTFAAPAAAILIALGVRAVPRRWAVAPALALGLALLVVLASQRTPFAKSGSDWAAAAAAVAAGAQAGDAVYFVPRWADEGRIGLTARRIAASYPSAFEGLVDLTLERTGAETDSIDGVSVPLEDVRGELDGFDTVWMLYGTHFPDVVVDDGNEVLSDAGFVPTVRWSGPRSVVVEYQRPE